MDIPFISTCFIVNNAKQAFCIIADFKKYVAFATVYSINMILVIGLAYELYFLVTKNHLLFKIISSGFYIKIYDFTVIHFKVKIIWLARLKILVHPAIILNVIFL